MNLKRAAMDRAFCRPRGWLGRVGGELMSLDRKLPSWVVDLLDLQPSYTLLEIGPGPGVGIEVAAARVPHGRVVGVDLSETMLAMARRRNRAQIEAGRVELRQGTVEHLPFDADSFETAMTINSLHLWPDPVRGLEEVARVLKPGGRVAVAVSRFSYASPDAFETLLRDSGFADIIVRHGDRGTCALGRAL